MKELYNVTTIIETEDSEGEARYFELTEDEVEVLRRTVHQTIPAGSAVTIRVTPTTTH